MSAVDDTGNSDNYWWVVATVEVITTDAAVSVLVQISVLLILLNVYRTSSIMMFKSWRILT